MHIRLAKLADIPALRALLHQLFSLEAEFSPDAAAQTRGLELILSQPESGWILLAEAEGQAVGMACVLYSVSTACGGRAGLLEDVVVAEGFRRQGVGDALLQAAIAMAKERGCLRLSLHTDRDNAPAQALYRRHGFQASAMLPMRLDLRGG